MNRLLPRRRTGMLAAAVTALGLLAGPAATAGQAAGAGSRVNPAAAQVAAPVPAITWSRCPDLFRTLCAVVEVPLDYGDPSGPTIQLDIAKVPALVAEEKIGTLFVNPGGPGGSARDFAPFAADLLGDTVALRYDVIGIDPRGVGAHSRMVCKKEGPFPAVPWLFPITEQESRRSWIQGRFFNAACKEHPNAIVAHMSTADTARDMDLIRQAIGEDQLNYYGISYGTYLGAVYAALFPDRVGRFVVDGVLDPVNWATGDGTNAELPFTTRINSARGAYEALTSGLAECDRAGRRDCAFAGDALGKWRALVRHARAGTLTWQGDKLPYSVLIGLTLGSLYERNYTFLGFILDELYAENFRARAAGRSTRAVQGLSLADLRKRAAQVIRAPYAARMFNVGDPFLGVACSDSQNPSGRETWWNAGRAQDKASPWFGSLWTWASAPCSGWAKSTKTDSYFGDFVTTPANPILVVGNSFDPATPVQGARKFTTLFEGSRFLLLEGWGHGAIGNACVTSAFDAYYSTGALPREGATCQPDGPLFGGDFFRSRPEPWRPQSG